MAVKMHMGSFVDHARTDVAGYYGAQIDNLLPHSKYAASSRNKAPKRPRGQGK